MVKQLASFCHSMWKQISFRVITTQGGNYHIKLDTTIPESQGLGWKTIDKLAKSSHGYWSVGGEGGGTSLTATIPMFDGTNYLTVTTSCVLSI